jgi:hypothetical protein
LRAAGDQADRATERVSKKAMWSGGGKEGGEERNSLPFSPCT